jgi:hypothetical protein
MADDRVLVTLEASYGREKDGTEKPVILRCGHEDATAMSGAFGEGDVPGGLDEIVDAGAHMGVFPRQRPRYRPGKPIDVVLVFGDPERDSGMLTRSQARLLFGHERIPKQAAPETDPRWTFGEERKRVAYLWGGWRLPRLALNGTTHCRKGENDFDLTKIGAPHIPRVRIESVDQRGRVKGTPFRPWEWFAWEDDVDATHPEIIGAPAAKQSMSPLAGYDLADLEAFIAARRAAERGEAARAHDAVEAGKPRDSKGHYVKQAVA